MLRRSSPRKPSCQLREAQTLVKCQSSTQSLSGDFQPPKIKKAVPNRKFNQNLKNPYCSIQECPAIQLTTEQMQGDFLGFLAELQKQFSSYGAVKLMASQDWSPPFTFKYIDHGITTRNQILQDLRLGKPFQQNIEAHTFSSFKAMAKQFEHKYQHLTKTDGTPFEQTEFQFWSLVTNPKYSKPEVEVEYAADIPTSKYCSAFPISMQSGSVDENFSYHDSYYNLNNTFKDPASLLKICEEPRANISGITQPWIYIGMKFSSFCWHVEDLYMNSLNYNHKGSTKTWYIVPESDKEKMDDYILNQYKHVSKGKKTFLHRMTLMINPLDLIKEGIKVYKINQSKKCYVVTFPKAYHCGFSQGFNLGEAVNYSILETLPVMIQAEEQYKLLNGKKCSVFPVEWIVDENYKALQSSKANTEWRKTITKQYQKYVSHELSLIKSLVKRKNVTGFSLMDTKKSKYHKNPCATCLQYLYFSMLRCKKCSKVHCLDHNVDCCQDEFQIVIRELSKERQPLLKILETIGQ